VGRRVLGLIVLLVAMLAFAPLSSATPGSATPVVRAIEFTNDVNPVTADYLISSLEKADRDQVAAAVIVLDTPGGLSDSMHEIVKAELHTVVPVIVYVPTGARAASAGVWIGQAADVLAMAPASNIGSSTPINVGGEDIAKDLRRKVVNDAAASLRALARTHGRNVAWADAAVRKASNLAADEALRKNVIDAVAPSLPALLEQVNGHTTKPRGFVLETAGAKIETVKMSAWQNILDTLIDPTLITILLSIGMLGIVIELYSPGLILPGTVGAVSLVLALYGLSVLSVNWAGFLLMLLAFGFFAGDLFVPTHGALTLAGAVCLVLGGLLLFSPSGPTYRVSLPVLIAIAASLVLMFGFALGKVAQARLRPKATGVGTLVGMEGNVRPGGLIFVNGELWRAESVGDQPLVPGATVEVLRVNELQLVVRVLDRAAPVT
jgi:membrane-bound serine protease (ClpP class)